MTESTMGSLRELQKIEAELRELESERRAFDPRLAEVEEPALELEGEVSKSQERLEQMKADSRRLQRASSDKEERIKRLEERLNQVTNVREEAAVQTELDLVRRAARTEEQEVYQLMEQIRRAEGALEELSGEAESARAEVGPRQASLLEERGQIEDRIAEIRVRRDAIVESLGDMERRVYESFRDSGRPVFVAHLTGDGACSNCWGVIPLQKQAEIRSGGGLMRCEACGVILSPEPEAATEPDPEA